MTIHSHLLDTPIGPLALLTLEIDGVQTLVGSGFTADPRELHERLHPSLRGHDLAPGAGPSPIVAAHRDYFDGKIDALDALPVHQPGSERRERLWAAMRQVPAGETTSYGRLAEAAGLPNAARAAGQACSQNLVAPTVPCHRVLPATGRMAEGNYYYGVDRKRWLLAHEAGSPDGLR